MTDGVAAFQPGTGGAPAPVRPRSAYARHEAFGAGDGAVLVDPQVARNLRRAAESATQEGRIAGGLLYGRCFADEQGTYLVISGYLEAGPGENRGDLISRDGTGQFTLSEPDLRLLRRDAARVYSASAEAGWWRSLPAAGEFGSRDYETQRALVGPRGAGLLVFGAGLDWGTAYVGPGALPPSTAGLALPPPRLAPGSPEVLWPEPDLAPDPGLAGFGPAAVSAGTVVVAGQDPELAPDARPSLAGDPGFDAGLGHDAGVDLDDDPDFDAGPEADDPVPDDQPATTLATWRQPVLTPAPRRTEPPAVSPVARPVQEWRVKPSHPSGGEPEFPTDVKIVVGLIVVVVIAAAVMIGMLVSNALAAVIVGVLGLLVICAFLWFARL